MHDLMVHILILIRLRWLRPRLLGEHSFPETRKSRHLYRSACLRFQRRIERQVANEHSPGALPGLIEQARAWVATQPEGLDYWRDYTRRVVRRYCIMRIMHLRFIAATPAHPSRKGKIHSQV